MASQWMPRFSRAHLTSSTRTCVMRRCLDVVRRGGQSIDGPFGRLIAFWTCDTLWFIDDVASRASTLDPAGFRSAADASQGYQAPGTFLTRYGPGRHDGVAAARDVSYDLGCACFVYGSGTYDVG